jgi:hypothetical protein
MQIVVPVSEEVILAEERTTEEEKMHIIEGECVFKFKFMLIMRCEISVAVKILIVINILTLHNLVGSYQRFGETCCLHLQGRRWRQTFPLKHS